MGSFFWGYIVTQIPGGRLAELFGARKLLGYGILSTSIFTLLTPVAARASDSMLIISRVLMGLGEVGFDGTSKLVFSLLQPRYILLFLSALIVPLFFLFWFVCVLKHTLTLL